MPDGMLIPRMLDLVLLYETGKVKLSCQNENSFLTVVVRRRLRFWLVLRA
jgi:hypothetical protein